MPNCYHFQYNLKYLDLTGCKITKVSGLNVPNFEALLDLTSHCYNLEKLSLANLNLSNPRWTQNIIQNCHTLKVLDLGYCTGRACYKIKSFISNDF